MVEGTGEGGGRGLVRQFGRYVFQKVGARCHRPATLNSPMMARKGLLIKQLDYELEISITHRN